MRKGRFAITAAVVKQIVHYDGLPGFYRGYTASLCAYVPNSALWWGFYHFYQGNHNHLLLQATLLILFFHIDQLHLYLPSWISHLLIQSISGTLGGFTTTVITNPLDIVRARLQVQRLNSIAQAFRDLWYEEGLRMFTKGLSARLVQSATFSFSIILGYETIKRVSVNEEYREFIRW